MVRREDIRWTLAPLPAADLFAMTDEDLLVETMLEAETYRTTVQAATRALHDLTVEHERLRVRHHRLLEVYRAERVRAAA